MADTAKAKAAKARGKADTGTKGAATASSSAATPSRDPLADELDRLVAGEHGDPHHVLGLHKTDDTQVVRAYRPDASAVAVVVRGHEPVAAERIHPAGVFAAEVPADAADGYRIEATYASGATHDVEDPYRFWPTLGDLDLHLMGEGRHHDLWKLLGAHHRTHEGVTGTSFAVWAPNAKSVRVVGEWNLWDGRLNPMRSLGSSGVWELFVPDVEPGMKYKYEIVTAQGHVTLKADPFAFATEEPPGTASVVAASHHSWGDDAWMDRRRETDWLTAPVSIYELHPGSWRRRPEEGDRPLTYRELAEELPEYVADLGFTHVELMPVAEHPFGGSWGYQVSSYFAPTARFGSPDDFRVLVEALHDRGIGVIVDWVPAHFPRDEWALARFDGTALFEHEDPRKGAHPDWGTLVFNYGRNEVRNFLISNALFWVEEFHIDGLRVDAVASMLYLDYSRNAGEWVPNEFGGRENLEAVSLLKEMNEVVYGRQPGVMTIAEESTAWPAVSRPTYLGGLGFGFKWNMGWMHDTLEYFSKEPIYRRYHHNELTFGLLYAFTENFILPLSHDEVVHGKGSLLNKMPGDRWQKAANLRSLYAWMWAHPGKQLLFMGGEIAQSAEWNHNLSLDWHLLEYSEHRGVQDLVRSINRVYRDEPALHEVDFSPEGFRWVDASDVDSNVLSFLRYSEDRSRVVACIANLSPVPRYAYRVGLPRAGAWRELVNTDAAEFGGSGVGNGGQVWAADEPWHGLDHSADVTLPPLGVLWLAPE
ncbi:MAG TPA: 1,4-alpha-glucan branching protein GlgB [Acidimicrobiales bacterium]|nr:1,4-alpha-glucan branching protein GlgB [Acidimicrobiales bacterium]